VNTIAWLLLGLMFGLIFVNIVRKRAQDGRLLLAGGIVVGAWIYVPLAITGNTDTRWLIVEVLGAALFTAMAWAGIRYSVWWLVAGWATHVLWDFGLHLSGQNTDFISAWYPLLCASFDSVVATYITFTMSQPDRMPGHQVHDPPKDK
jgi:uncharacterized protein DUF6010